MQGAATRIAAAARSGAAFAAEGWRDAWAPLTLVAAGQALAFVSARLDIPNILAGRLELGGWLLSALALLPALGALYRSAVGGPALKRIGWGGLQLQEVERGLLGTSLVLLLAGAAAVGILLMAGAAAWYPLRNLGVVRLPLIGPFGLWFLAAAPVLAGVGWVLLIGLSQLALILPAVAGERRVQLGRILKRSRRWSGSLAASTLLLEIAPLATLLVVVQGLNVLERGQAGGLVGAVWPTPDAVVAGVVLSLLWAFVLLPVGVGARTYFYGRVLAEDRAAQRRSLVAEAAASTQADRSIALHIAEAEPAPTDAVSEPDRDETPAVAAMDQADNQAIAQEPALEEVAAAQRPDDDPTSRREPVQPHVHHETADADAQEAVAQRAATGGGARWVPPVAPLRAAGLAQPVTTPILLAHANDRDLPPPWWMPPEHPEGPPVA